MLDSRTKKGKFKIQKHGELTQVIILGTARNGVVVIADDQLKQRQRIISVEKHSDRVTS